MKPLSANMLQLKMLFPLVTAFFGTFFFISLTVQNHAMKVAPLLALWGLCYYWIQRIASNTYKLSYNSWVLLLKNKVNQRTIDLAQIVHVSRIRGTRIRMGVEYLEYCIDFKNEKGIQETVYFYVRSFQSNMQEFQALVKKAAPEAEISN